MPGKPEATSVAKSLGKLDQGTEGVAAREASTGDGKPAHRGTDEGPKPTKASLKASIEARPRGYVPHHSSMWHQGGAR